MHLHFAAHHHPVQLPYVCFSSSVLSLPETLSRAADLQSVGIKGRSRILVLMLNGEYNWEVGFGVFFVGFFWAFLVFLVLVHSIVRAPEVPVENCVQKLMAAGSYT